MPNKENLTNSANKNPGKKQGGVVPTKKHLARLERENIQRRYLLIGTAIIAVLVVGLIVAGLLDNFVLKYNIPVVQVGDRTLTVRDFQTETKFQRYQLIQRYEQYYQMATQFEGDPFGLIPEVQNIQAQLTDSTQLGNAIVKGMAANLVIEREAQKRGITVTDAEVEDFIQGLYGYYPKGTPTSTVTPTLWTTSTLSAAQLKAMTATPTVTPGPSPTPTNTPTFAPTATLLPSPTPGAGTPTAVPPTPTTPPTATPSGPTPTATITLTPTITSTPTPYTEELYKDAVKKNQEVWAAINFNDADLRKIMRYQLLSDKLSAEFEKEIPTSEERVWARHILLTDEATANATLARIQQGEDFGKVASELSIDTGSKINGGDLGWFGKGQMIPAFEEATYKLSVGEISAPIKGDSGYHIIQLLGKEVQPLTAEEIKTKAQTKFNAWIEAQIAPSETSDVKIFDTWTRYTVSIPAFSPKPLPQTSQSDIPGLDNILIPTAVAP